MDDNTCIDSNNGINQSDKATRSCLPVTMTSTSAATFSQVLLPAIAFATIIAALGVPDKTAQIHKFSMLLMSFALALITLAATIETVQRERVLCDRWHPIWMPINTMMSFVLVAPVIRGQEGLGVAIIQWLWAFSGQI